MKILELNIPSESLGFNRQQMLDVTTTSENTIQVNPSTLHINPNIKQGEDTIQLVIPLDGVFLKYLSKQKKYEIYIDLIYLSSLFFKFVIEIVIFSGHYNTLLTCLRTV